MAAKTDSCTRRRGLPVSVPGLLALAVLACALLVPLLDPHATERDPLHGHLAVGGNAVERARALVSHLRSSTHEDSCTTGLLRCADPCVLADGYEADARVLSLRAPSAAGASIYGLGGSVLLTAGVPVIPPAVPAARLGAPDAMSTAGMDLPVPEPPPRSS